MIGFDNFHKSTRISGIPLLAGILAFQVLDCCLAFTGYGLAKWGLPVIVGCVDIGTVLDQQLEELHIAVPGCHMHPRIGV